MSHLFRCFLSQILTLCTSVNHHQVCFDRTDTVGYHYANAPASSVDAFRKAVFKNFDIPQVYPGMTTKSSEGYARASFVGPPTLEQPRHLTELRIFVPKVKSGLHRRVAVTPLNDSFLRWMPTRHMLHFKMLSPKN